MFKKLNYKLLIGILIFSAYFLSLVFTSKDTGIFWDESAYYQASLKYLEWFKNPSFKTIDNYFLKYAPKVFELHPPLEKIAQAASFELFYNKLHLMNYADSFKFPNIVFASLIIFSVYLFSLKYFGFGTALFSSIFLTITPRFFGHAHFAAMDIPLTLFVFLSFCFLWKYKDKNFFIPGIFLGLAFSTKATGLLFLLPFSFFLIVRNLILKKNLLKTILNITFMTFIMFIIFIALWPKIWVDPAKRLIEFFGFFSENKVPFYYFGQTTFKPPWHFPWVMLGITTPILILLLSVLGSLSYLFEKKNKELKLFILINFLFLPTLLSLPQIAAYDAERLLLPSFPFMVILAGIGLNFIISRLSLSKNLRYLFIGLVIISSSYMIIHYYPFELSSYNLLVGGLKGAEKIGMEPQYTLESLKATLPFLNKSCPDYCYISVFYNGSPYFWYEKDNLLRQDFIIDSFFPDIPERSNFVVLPIRKSFFTPGMWKLYLEAKPIYSYKVDGVSLVNIYKP